MTCSTDSFVLLVVQKHTSETRRWELISNFADRKILNLDDESRNDHPNAIIVQDGYTCWLQS